MSEPITMDITIQSPGGHELHIRDVITPDQIAELNGLMPVDYFGLRLHSMVDKIVEYGRQNGADKLTR